MDLGRWVMLARSWKAEPAAEGNAHAKAKASWLQSNPQDYLVMVSYFVGLFWAHRRCCMDSAGTLLDSTGMRWHTFLRFMDMCSRYSMLFSDFLGLFVSKTKRRLREGCTPPLAYIMHEHLMILFYLGLTFEKQWRWGRGVPPHWHTLCMNIWSSYFIQVWHGLTPKNTMKVGEGVCPPIGIHYAWTSDHLILFRFDMLWP